MEKASIETVVLAMENDRQLFKDQGWNFNKPTNHRADILMYIGQNTSLCIWKCLDKLHEMYPNIRPLPERCQNCTDYGRESQCTDYS